MKPVSSEQEKDLEGLLLQQEKGRSYFSNLLMNISQKAEPYKIFSQLIRENVFTDEELEALEQLIKSRK